MLVSFLSLKSFLVPIVVAFARRGNNVTLSGFPFFDGIEF